MLVVLLLCKVCQLDWPLVEAEEKGAKPTLTTLVPVPNLEAVGVQGRLQMISKILLLLVEVLSLEQVAAEEGGHRIQEAWLACGVATRQEEVWLQQQEVLEAQRLPLEHLGVTVVGMVEQVRQVHMHMN